MAKSTFRLNRAALQAEVLNGQMVSDVVERAAKAGANGMRVTVDRSDNSRKGGRVRARIIDDSYDALQREARSGHLTRALGQARI